VKQIAEVVFIGKLNNSGFTDVDAVWQFVAWRRAMCSEFDGPENK
jgi:hypothetical protein